jgi:hypothetical protein
VHEEFIAAIHERRKVRVTFRADDDGLPRIRTCAPMDLGPRRNAKDRTPRYWFWDHDSPGGPHTLGLRPDQIVSFESTEEAFDPAEFVDWTPNWFVPRDWGQYS